MYYMLGLGLNTPQTQYYIERCKQFYNRLAAWPMLCEFDLEHKRHYFEACVYLVSEEGVNFSIRRHY